MQMQLYWRVGVIFGELFAWMERAPDYDRKPESTLIAKINKEEYGPKEYSPRLGLYGAQYTIVFKLGKCQRQTCKDL
jgi:hypothetical protein